MLKAPEATGAEKVGPSEGERESQPAGTSQVRKSFSHPFTSTVIELVMIHKFQELDPQCLYYSVGEKKMCI